MLQLISFYLSLSLITLTSAIPFPYPYDIPTDASYLALDTRSGHLIAFHASGENLGTFSVPRANSSALTKRGGTGSCSELKLDDAKKLPGWSKLEARAKENWGGGSYNIVINPEEYKDRPATVCISTDTVPVVISGKPNCRTQTQSTEGSIVGSDGSITLSSQQGSQLSQRTSVTQESSIAAGMSITAHVGIPEIAEVTASMETKVTLSNSLTKDVVSTANTMQTQTVNVRAPEGSTCHLDFTSKTCDFSGSGNIRFYATGWVWFNYNSQTKGHYKWALNIDEVLNNIDDRSSTMKLDISGNLVTKSKFKGTCDKKASTKAKVNTKANKDTGPKTDMKPKANTKPTPNTKPKVNTKPKANTKPKVNAKPKANTKAPTNTNVKGNTNAKPKSKSK